LLAGLFGSAFVPTAYAAAPTVAVTSSNKDGADATAKTYSYLSTVNPAIVITATSAGADDLGGYEVTVSGTTILGCVGSGTAGTQSAVIAGPQTCAKTVSVAVDTSTVIFTLSLKKLAVGASATIALTGPSDADNSTALTLNYTTLTSIASTAASTVVNATKSQAKFLMNSDGDAGLSTTLDVADEVIGGVNYFLPAQTAKKAIYAGTLQNAGGTAILAVTGLIAEISNTTFSVQCDGTVDAAVSSTGAATTVAVSSTITSGVFECGVFSDGAASAGGSWTLTVKVATTGTVVGIASGAFYGEVASITASLVAGDRVPTVAGADIDDSVLLVVKDAAGKQYGLAETTALTIVSKQTVAAATATSAGTLDDGTSHLLKNHFKLDDALCPATSAGKTATVQASITNGSAVVILSNTLTVNCAAAAASALTIKKIEFEKSNPVPGEAFDVHVYMEDGDGVLAGSGDVATANFALSLTGATETGTTWDGTTVTAATSAVNSYGYIVFELKAPSTVGTAITLNDPVSSVIAKVYTTNDAYAGVLTVGPKKLKVTADFGPAAASKKVAFVLESASGTTKTYYRKANASGVASYTLGLRGTWTVYATFGDEISDTGSMKK
jgi:hypothetical protein